MIKTDRAPDQPCHVLTKDTSNCNMSSIIHIFFHRCYSTPQHLMTYISGTPKCNSDNGCTPIYYRLDTLAACVLHGSWLLSCCCSLAWTSQRHCCCCSAPPSCTLSTWNLLMQFSFTPFECTGKNCPSPVVSFFFFCIHILQIQAGVKHWYDVDKTVERSAGTETALHLCKRL